MEKIGLGGSCHWCTEAIFQSLYGVSKVYQGWISSIEIPEFSEAVILDYDPQKIALDVLIEIHLHTHSCTSNHSLRTKYRSAIYCFDAQQETIAAKILNNLRNDFDEEIISKILGIKEFKLNKATYLNYYYNDPSKPFCKNVINPKLRLLIDQYNSYVNVEDLEL